jgi:Ca-activated chloride channel family protein
MNRTALFVAAAMGLALTALVVGLPKTSAHPDPTPERPTAIPTPPPAQADGTLKMKGRLSHPYVAIGQSDLFLTVDLEGAELPGQERTPVNLALVIDRSGSMHGQKLAQAKNAARHLVQQLKATDQLAIVHYGSDVKTFASRPATPENKERMNQFIDAIIDDGGTDIGAGLEAGRAQLQGSGFKVNRLILISDGQPTVGVTDSRALTQLAQDTRALGITVSSIGVGLDFNEELMQGIAELGAGAYGYLKDASQLATLFQRDLLQASRTVARQVQLSFELPPGVELRQVLGYRSVQVGRTVTVNLPDFAAGQREQLVAQLSVTGVTPATALDVAALTLTYDDAVKDQLAKSTAQLSAMVTDRQEEVLARRDKDATVLATRAVSAQNLQKAARSLRSGDKQKAELLLKENDLLFEGAAAVTGVPALAPARAENRQMLQLFGDAKDDADVQDAVKGAEKKARQDFGRLGSTY